MKRSVVLFSLLLLVIAIVGVIPRVQAQFGNSPEAVAARQKQLALEKTVPQLKITEEHLTLVAPGHTLGETKACPRTPKATCLFTHVRAPAAFRVAGRPRSCSSSTKI